MTKRVAPSREQIAGIDVPSIPEANIAQAITVVNRFYVSLGGSDQIAKGTELLERLKAEAQTSFAQAGWIRVPEKTK